MIRLDQKFIYFLLNFIKGTNKIVKGLWAETLYQAYPEEGGRLDVSPPDVRRGFIVMLGVGRRC
jgi:hypothetical protein